METSTLQPFSPINSDNNLAIFYLPLNGYMVISVMRLSLKCIAEFKIQILNHITSFFFQ